MAARSQTWKQGQWSLLPARARPKRCLAGFRVSFCSSFWQRGAGEQAERNEKQNENETKNTVEVEPCETLALGLRGALLVATAAPSAKN